MTPQWPLAVDLDGTLIYGDVSVATARMWLRRAPLAFARSAPALVGRRAAFKRRMAQAQSPPQMRVRTRFLDWLIAQSEAGRSLHLITGADQSFAEYIAGPLKLFDTIEGSDGAVNLVGPAKARRLSARFPAGFTYAGDSAQDLAVFAQARSIVLVGASPLVGRRAARLGVPVEAEFE